MKKTTKRKIHNFFWFFLGIFFCYLSLNYYILTPLKEPVVNLLNSNFSTAFFGAAGGSFTILFLDWLKRQRQILSDINTSIGLLASLSNTLLNMKKQHTLPIFNNYQENFEKMQNLQILMRLNPNPPEPVTVNFDMLLTRFHCPELYFDLPLDRIFALTDNNPQIVPIISQTKRTVGEVKTMCDIWNQIIEKLNSLEEEQKKSFYFGTRSRADLVDTNFPDTVKNLNYVVDDGLFFINLSIEALQKLGGKTLPFWLREKIAKSEITSDEYKALMPPENYKEGWRD